ncbi:MAG: alpha/beta fold hydrolase [Pseudomonadota bacterium]
MVTLQYQTYGSVGCPALILLHGLLGSSTNWSSIGRQLSTDYYVLVPDLRNHAVISMPDTRHYRRFGIAMSPYLYSYLLKNINRRLLNTTRFHHYILLR